MKSKITSYIFIMIYMTAKVLSAEPMHIILYDEYIAGIEKSLPELMGNEMNVLSAENKVKSAKSGGDISLTAGGNAYSKKQYSSINDKGDVKGYEYYAGLSKTITSTGTTVGGTYNYSKNNYNNFSSTDDYSSYEPSYTIKITQPLLYNFLGKVDRFSENNANMQLEISKLQLHENNKSVLNAYKKLYFQWIMYRSNIKKLDEAISNSKILKEQIKRKVNAGLADNDDYQGSVSSVLNYENQRREYLTALKNVENQIRLYLDTNLGIPDEKFFDDVYAKAASSNLNEVNFKSTTSARIMDLTMKNYAYSKGVYENKLLPELNVFAGITKKDIAESQTYGSKDTDYNVGFEFKYTLENNSAESSLKDVEIQIKSLEYEYKSTENSYRKQILNSIEYLNGIEEQIANKETSLKALKSKLATEKRKYNQARLNLSYVIETENSITTEENNIIELKYNLISYYIDYMDLVK